MVTRALRSAMSPCPAAPRRADLCARTHRVAGQGTAGYGTAYQGAIRSPSVQRRAWPYRHRIGADDPCETGAASPSRRTRSAETESAAQIWLICAPYPLAGRTRTAHRVGRAVLIAGRRREDDSDPP